jgi:hypothetical protein
VVSQQSGGATQQGQIDADLAATAAAPVKAACVNGVGVNWTVGTTCEGKTGAERT